MGPETLSIFIPIIIFGSGAILIGMKMRYSHLEDTRLSGQTQQESEHLVGDLRAEVELLRDEVGQLNERVDFTERLLEGPKTEE